MRAGRALLALFVALAFPAAAQQPAGPAAYTVEIVVFRGGTGSAGEDLSPSAAVPPGEADAGGVDAGPSRFLERLPASRHRLGDVVSRLNASGAYRVIAHAAWQQTAGAYNSRSGVGLEQVGLGSAGLSGVAFLQRGQYLHLGFNLTYRASGAYTLTELRRVKLNERQYFDHPAFGVIALVTPAGP